VRLFLHFPKPQFAAHVTSLKANILATNEGIDKHTYASSEPVYMGPISYAMGLSLQYEQ
jgi:hypothetical protein